MIQREDSTPERAPLAPDLLRSLQSLVGTVREYAIFLLDASGHVLTWNPGAQAIKGYSEHEIVGKHFSVFYPPEDVAAGKCEHELAVASETGRFEDYGWRVRKDGSRFFANVVITALRDASGKVTGFGKVTRDITTQREREEALRLSEERFRLLVGNVRDYAIFMLDPEGRVASWNAGAERIKGYTAEEVVGRHFRIFYTPEDVANGKCERELETARTAGRYEEEGLRVRKDGATFWANVVITPVHDEHGALRGYAKITRDVSERKRAEAKTRELLARLEVSNRELQDFATVASHDLQEPLRKVMAFGDRLKTHLGASLDEQARDYLQRMQRATQRMQQLINDLLAFSRVTTKAKPFEPVSLGEVAVGVKADLEARLEEAKGTVEIDALPTIEADATQMRQLLQNLIGNALKYRRKDVAPVVRVSAEQEDGRVRLLVADNGIGFDEKYLDRLFTIFQRLHGKNEYEGTGVGLAICRKIAERHAGAITARSRPGEGSTFIVTLPVKHPKEAGP